MTDSDFPQLEIKNTDTEKVTELFMWENDKWICELAIALRENCWYNLPHSGGNELFKTILAIIEHVGDWSGVDLLNYKKDMFVSLQTVNTKRTQSRFLEISIY